MTDDEKTEGSKTEQEAMDKGDVVPIRDPLRMGSELKIHNEPVGASINISGGTPLTITFRVGEEDVLVFEEAGKVYVRGERVDHNSVMYAALKTWLARAVKELK